MLKILEEYRGIKMAKCVNCGIDVDQAKQEEYFICSIECGVRANNGL
jgi:hypothetical protein